MTDEQQIFDASGMLRTDLENVVVPDERRPAFDALVASVNAGEIAEAKLKEMENAIADAVKVRARAVASMPRHTFHDEWLLSTGRIPAGMVALPAGENGHNDGSAILTAEHALDLARERGRQARQAVADARAAVARCLSDYNASMPTCTPYENTRAYLASTAREREDRAAGRIPPRAYTGGRSQVDRMAAAMSGGTGPGPQGVRMPDGTVQVQGGLSRAGGGAAFKRGAYSKAQAAIANAARARAIRRGH